MRVFIQVDSDNGNIRLQFRINEAVESTDLIIDVITFQTMLDAEMWIQVS